MIVLSFHIKFPDPPGPSGVYMLRNRYNKRTYIGSSRNMARRWTKHVSALRNKSHKNKNLQADYNRYGPESFEWFPLKYCAEADLLDQERAYADWLGVSYNIQGVGQKQSLEERTKVSAARRARYASTRPEITKATWWTIDGVSKSQQQWAESVGMSPTLLSARVKRRGMTPKEALETPVRQWARKT